MPQGSGLNAPTNVSVSISVSVLTKCPLESIQSGKERLGSQMNAHSVASGTAAVRFRCAIRAHRNKFSSEFKANLTNF